MNHIPSKYEQTLVPASATVKEALARINALRGVPLTLFAISADNRLEGTLTDGDIRRGLLSGATLSTPVSEVMNRSFHAVRPDQDSVKAIESARALNLALLPVTDAAGRLTDILDLRTRRSLLPIDAILMAGGRGERLRPLTLTTPKPLLPVGPKAIIDYNVDALAACGVRHIFVTVNYLHELIEQHFAPAREDGVQVTTVLETQPLGTFGSIGLVKGLTCDDTLVMNSDLLTDLNFEQMYRLHKTPAPT